MASNQEEAFRRARDAAENAKKAGVKGRDLAVLTAAADARKAERDSATGGGGSWGILS